MGYKVKRIMMRPNGVEKQVRPVYKPRTFTISRTEQSNMSSGWTYSDDAAGLTAGSTAFDEFFGYSAVKLSAAGVETAEVTQATPGQLNLSSLGTLTSGDNVMIKFPVRGIKMTKSGSTVTLSITDGLNRGGEGYQYYAHCTGTLSNPGTPKDAFYLGTYLGYSSSNVLKSWSGVSPSNNYKQSQFCTKAKANGSGYNIMGYYQKMYISALYMMKYGNPDGESVVGMGYTGGNARVNTGGTNNQINATYGTSSTTQQMKLFGLEDWWGNMKEFIGGAYTDSNTRFYLYTQLSGYSGALSGGESTGSIIRMTASNYTCISSIVGNNKAMFGPNGEVKNTNNNTYYCDPAVTSKSSLLITSGYWGSSRKEAGLFGLYANVTADTYGDEDGARLMYL